MDVIKSTRSLRRFFGLLVVSFLLVALNGSGATVLAQSGDGLGLKSNLDLPFDAGGSDEEDEEAPEIIVFFGQVYETTGVVLALDQSGSMRSKNRWEIQSREVIKTITELTQNAEFGIVYYGDDVFPFRQNPADATQSNKTAGVAFVQSRSPGGNTCLREGTIKALQIVRQTRGQFRAVIVTSDGKPDTCGGSNHGNSASATERTKIITDTMAANPGLAVRVHTIWVGSGGDDDAMKFMRRLASAHGGTFRQVSN